MLQATPTPTAPIRPARQQRAAVDVAAGTPPCQAFMTTPAPGERFLRLQLAGAVTCILEHTIFDFDELLRLFSMSDRNEFTDSVPSIRIGKRKCYRGGDLIDHLMGRTAQEKPQC